MDANIKFFIRNVEFYLSGRSPSTIYIRYFDNVEFELICEFKIEGNNLKAASKSVLKFWKDTILLGENCLQRDKSWANWQIETPSRVQTEKHSREAHGHMLHTHSMCIRRRNNQTGKAITEAKENVVLSSTWSQKSSP